MRIVIIMCRLQPDISARLRTAKAALWLFGVSCIVCPGVDLRSVFEVRSVTVFPPTNVTGEGVHDISNSTGIT